MKLEAGKVLCLAAKIPNKAATEWIAKMGNLPDIADESANSVRLPDRMVSMVAAEMRGYLPEIEIAIRSI